MADTNDPWLQLGLALNSLQREALLIALEGGEGLKDLADENGIMVEVLMEGINDLAMDYVGDSLTDEEFLVYEDYREDVKRMVEKT